MADSSNNAAAATPLFDPGVQYRAALNRKVKVRSLDLLPRNEHIISGGTLNDIVAEHGADVVAIATPAT